MSNSTDTKAGDIVIGRRAAIRDWLSVSALAIIYATALALPGILAALIA